MTQPPGFSLPNQITPQTTVINQPQLTRAKSLYEYQQQQQQDEADQSYRDKETQIFQKIGIQQNPYSYLQLVATLLIDANETLYQWMKKAGPQKIQRTTQSLINYLQFCGVATVTLNEQALISLIAQMSYDMTGLQGCAKITQEVFKDAKRMCAPKK